MGLITDPAYGSAKWVRILNKIHGPVCILCYVGALVWFVMLGNKEFNNETYFSENALLPGLVTNDFHAENSANQFYKELLQELEDKYEDNEEMPVPWLVAKMSQLHLEVYTHNFTLNYPMGQGQVYKGTNVYGILRGARSPSLEALVLAVPHRARGMHQKSTAAGIALMLAFAEFARPQKYWAKDIIFLITEHEQLGMQAWLEAYHGLHSDTETFYSSLGSFWHPSTSSIELSKFLPGFTWTVQNHHKCLDPGQLKGRSGSIQAAINLEFHTPSIKYVEVKVEGLNGQLPNLDLVNLVHKLCVKSGIHHSYKNSYSWIRNRDKTEEWVNGIKTMLGMMTAQIAGVPSGNHGLFHRFGIEAVTLEGRAADDPAGVAPRAHALTSCNFYRLGVAIESIFRSLNNLLERFHQSYFFYILAATNRFISIGLYIPSLCLLCLAMLIRALSLWVSIQEVEDVEETEKTLEKNNKESNSATENSLLENADNKKDKLDKKLDKYMPKKEDKAKDLEKSSKMQKKKMERKLNTNLVNMGINYLLVHFLGVIAMNITTTLTQIGATYFHQPSEVSIYYGLAAVSVLYIIATPFLPRLCAARMTREELTLVNILLLVELSTACLCVGMHNFSLGFAIATLYTPVALVAGVVTKGTGKRRAFILFLRRALCLLSHPLLAVTLGMVVYGRVLFPEESLLGALARGRDAAMQATMFAVTDALIYGNWLFSVATTVALPVWLLFWQLLCNEVNEV